LNNKIKLVGAGQIGSRYLQGLANYKNYLDIEVFDINQNSLNIAKKRFLEINSNKNNHKIQFKTKNLNFENYYDLIIISTSSKNRSKIIAEYKNKSKVKFWLIEKILEQSSEDVKKILSCLDNKEKNIAWVNTPRRAMKFYSDLKQKIGTEIPKRINLHGGLWGMACNSIHFIDLVEWLTDQHLISVDTTNIDKKWVETKRPGYFEVTGETSLRFSKGTELLLQSDPIHNNYLINIEISEDNSWEINEHEGYMRHSSGELIFGKLSKISEISTKIIQNILKNETCDLTNLRDSCRQHSIILNSFLDHWNKYNNKKDKKVPIT
tara:strand:+ start:566 stop:1531 length:966 start_codon:yes stop_codon:yes gene_type:complete